MVNFIQKGDIIDFFNSTGKDILYGQVVVMGNHIGIAAENITQGKNGGLRTNGVFEFTGVKADTISIGDNLYYDPDKDAVTNNKGYLTVVAGFARSSKEAEKDGTILVKLFNSLSA